MHPNKKNYNVNQSDIYLITQYDADLILLQEDLYPSPLETIGIPGHAMIGICRAEPLTWPRIVELYPNSKYLANSIYAKYSFIDRKKISISQQNMSQNCVDPRCSVIADFGLFSIANVHLCGGRYVDEIVVANAPDAQRSGLIYSKDLSLQHLIDTHNPTFIGGDFNGERDRNILQSLGNYSLLNQISVDAKKDFVSFFQS